MKTKIWFLTIIVCLIHLCSTGYAVTIDFDDIDATGGIVAITSQYQSQGVIFEDLYVYNPIAYHPDATWYKPGGPWAVLYSPFNVGLIDDEDQLSLLITVTFKDPATGLPSVTDHVGALFFDSEVGTRLVKMTAYGLFGNVLDVIDVTTPAQTYAIVELNVPGIHRVTLETGSDGTAFDNLTFNDVQPIPCGQFGDINEDGKIGLEEAIHALKIVAGLSPVPVSSAPVPVEKTGQTASYATGDDGDLKAGVAWPNPRFTDNGDGTVKDNLTGLVWLKDANALGERTWSDALTQVANLNIGTDFSATDYTAGTYSDWRLPNIKELQSLIDFGNYNPALPSGHPFINVQSIDYWSSTTTVNDTSKAWSVGIRSGFVLNPRKDIGGPYCVWPVRGGN